MGSFWAKYIFFELKKYREVIFHETKEGYEIWRGIGLLFQNWHKEFDKFWLEHSKVSKIFTLRDFFWENYIFFELKKYRGVIFYETEEGFKIWREMNLFQNWHKEFDKFWCEYLKVSKIFTLMGSFWVKYILFELKRYREVIFHKRKRDTKCGEELTCRFKIDIRNLTNFDLSTRLLNKVYIVWAKKVERSYLSWHWRVMQNLKKNSLVAWKMTGIRQIFTRAIESVKIGILMGSYCPK